MIGLMLSQRKNDKQERRREVRTTTIVTNRPAITIGR